MAKKFTINDTDREGWVDNDEGLHQMQRRSRLSMRRFVRENRDLIDSVIRAANITPNPYPCGYMQQRGAA